MLVSQVSAGYILSGAMTIEYLWKGLVIGILVAAPLGPVGLLCVHRVLAERRRRAGVISGVGSAAADTLYACVATWFMSYATRLINDHTMAVAVGGGALLCIIGVRLLRCRPRDQADPDQRGTLWSHFLSTFLLTLANPITVFVLAAAFAVCGPRSVEHTLLNKLTLIGGVFSGSVVWFTSLSLLVGMVRLHMTPDRLRWVNVITGLAMLCFGVAVLVEQIVVGLHPAAGALPL